MKIAWAENYMHSLPEGHRFPMAKYELIPQQLLYEGIIEQSEIFRPSSLSVENILYTHTNQYWQKLQFGYLTKSEIRKIGFPYSSSLIERECTIANGTLMCALYSLDDGIAFNTAGGTHHSFADRGEGFCILNDIAIAANTLLISNRVSKILVLDLDVHQGNGTAKIFQNKNEVYTISIHGRNNFPMFKEQSCLDIPLEDGTSDEEYLTNLEFLPRILDRIRPQIIFYQAGVDVLETDKLGKLNLSQEGCKARDKYVFDLAYQQGIPICVTMGGGYSERLVDIVNAHCNTFKVAKQVFGK